MNKWFLFFVYVTSCIQTPINQTRTIGHKSTHELLMIQTHPEALKITPKGTVSVMSDRGYSEEGDIVVTPVNTTR
jgi:hypothetical protein